MGSPERAAVPVVTEPAIRSWPPDGILQMRGG
jgi:hypothetical protein